MSTLPSMYLINLDQSTDRLLAFRQRNQHLSDVTRVAATDGRTFDRDTLIRLGYITDDLPYGAGTLGSAVSHKLPFESAIRLAANEGGIAEGVWSRGRRDTARRPRERSASSVDQSGGRQAGGFALLATDPGQWWFGTQCPRM